MVSFWFYLSANSGRFILGVVAWLLVLFFTANPMHAAQTIDKYGYGIAMVDIPSGNFLMGSCKVPSEMAFENQKRAFLGQPLLDLGCTPDKIAKDDEAPQHNIQLGAFKMSKTEVTLGQFKQFIIEEERRDDLLTNDFMKYNNRGDNAPVVYVSWHDAQLFIAWLNKKTGKNNYRLPTEAQWEYACRAGGRHTYCGSDSIDAVAWHVGNSGGQQHPVGQKQANAFGLFDMSGNVMEWTQDLYGESYYNNSPAVDPLGPESAYTDGVVRGGSWSAENVQWGDVPSGAVRSATRYHFAPTTRYNRIGFRVAFFSL